MTPRERLADLMEARARELGMRWEDVAAAGGPAVRTLQAIRKDGKPIRWQTSQKIEDGLYWERGSVAAIEAGGDPVPLRDARPARHPAPLAASSGAAQQLMPQFTAEIKAAVLAACTRYGVAPGDLTGMEIFGATAEARVWDGLREMGTDVEGLVAALAIARATAEAARAQSASRRADPSAN